MSNYEFHLIAAGWSLLILILTIFWYVTLRRLSEVLKSHLPSAHSAQSISGCLDVVRFLFSSGFKRTGDDRLIAVCERLRKLLYGYFGSIGAYVVFLVIMRPRF